MDLILINKIVIEEAKVDILKFKTFNALWKNVIFMFRCGADCSSVLQHINSVQDEDWIANSHSEIVSEYCVSTRSKKFSQDWFGGNIPHWVRAFELCEFGRGDPLRILEIGSFEGRSALFFMTYFSSATIDCVDTWLGSDEHEGELCSATLERTFRDNLEGTPVQMHVMTSADFFIKSESREYDIIYIDGSHRACDVLLDLVSAFSRLRKGGLLMLDDYLWKHYSNSDHNPCVAINSFIRIYKAQFEFIRLGYQVHLKKI